MRFSACIPSAVISIAEDRIELRPESHSVQICSLDLAGSFSLAASRS